jgi:hypothetical protein
MRFIRPAHRLILPWILSALLGACGGGGGGAGTDGRNALTAVSAAGDQCENGGSKIEAGIDADGNGSLGTNEVSSTHYACDGAAGSTGEPGATLNWVAQSEAVTAKPNTGYIATGTSTVVVTLPDKDQIAIGDVVRVIGDGAGGWKIAQTGSAQEVRLASLAQASWTAIGPHINSHTVDISSDGRILVAAEFNGPIHISTDGGLNWTAQTSASNWPLSRPSGNGAWAAVACSVDCSRLVAAEQGGSIYFATRSDLDGSWTWTDMRSATGQPWDAPQDWTAVSSSDDGGTVAAVADGGNAYIWNGTDSNPQWIEAGHIRRWRSVTVAGDGRTAMAVGENAIYIWEKATGTWTPMTAPSGPSSSGRFGGVASSYDGSVRVVVEDDGFIYVSINGGEWERRESYRDWAAVASSADGKTLVAMEYPGLAYISTDSGASWTVMPGDSYRWWWAVAISADGSTVAAVEDGGHIQVARDRTTRGKDGYISGDASEAVELIYLGNDRFGVLSHEGRLTIR